MHRVRSQQYRFTCSLRFFVVGNGLDRSDTSRHLNIFDSTVGHAFLRAAFSGQALFCESENRGDGTQIMRSLQCS